jgi:hypothetical protein
MLSEIRTKQFQPIPRRRLIRYEKSIISIALPTTLTMILRSSNHVRLLSFCHVT